MKENLKKEVLEGIRCLGCKTLMPADMAAIINRTWFLIEVENQAGVPICDRKVFMICLSCKREFGVSSNPMIYASH